MSWQDLLLPASWRGVPFAVRTAGIRPGRQTAIHGYPYRDEVWVEDLGRGPRPFQMSGFLVDGDVLSLGLGVFEQRDLMAQACQQPGPGVLVHPSLGARTVSLIGGAEMVESAEFGGCIELHFEFLETVSGPAYPANPTDTASGVATASGNLGGAAAGDFASRALGAVQTGAAVVQQAVTTVAGFARLASTSVQTASAVAHAVTGLAGYGGRYSGGGRLTLQPASASVASLLAGATAARTLVDTAGALAQKAAAAL